MQELGKKFKQRRKELDIDLDQARDETNIKLGYLQAIENGNFDQIEAEVYLKGFLKVYSNYLDLNTEEIMEEYRQLKEPEEEPEEDDESIKDQVNQFIDEHQNTVLGVFVGALILILAAVGVYIGSVVYTQFIRGDFEGNITEYASEITTIFQAESEEDESASGAVEPDENSTVDEPEPITPEEETEVPGEETSEEVPEQEEPLEQEEAESGLNGETVTETANNDVEAEEITIEVETIEESWYLVEVDGEEVFRDLVAAEEVNTFSGQEIEIRIGNAAGVQIIHAGEELGPFGAKGEIVTREFSSEPTEESEPEE